MTHPTSDEDLFGAALIMPSEERPHFLARACADDAATRSRLSGLLEADKPAVAEARVRVARYIDKNPRRHNSETRLASGGKP
jgi:hypothetical protein